MNCEHVEDLLSAYLDNALASEERTLVAAHLQACPACSEVLADFRRFDTLLADLPRISPDVSLRDRIFSSPEYLELTGTTDHPMRIQQHRHITDQLVDNNDRPTVPHKRVLRDAIDRPRLVALPGGLHSTSSSIQGQQSTRAIPRLPQHRVAWGQRIMQLMIAACLLLTIGVGSFIGWNLFQEQGKTAKDSGITPPQGPRVGGPIPAGTRFVFLRDGALWSGPTDGSTTIVRLTPPSVTVATQWTVRPPLPGRAAGDMLAYIDLRQGYLHIIRSDGQSDTLIKQRLLGTGVQPSSVWETSEGSAILNSLAWSQDGSILAFIAAPTGTPQLYLYSSSTSEVRALSLPVQGAVYHPVWSPDSTRIAFEFSHDGSTSILDYNTQNSGVLTIASTINTKQNPADTVLTLDWSPNLDIPTITWSTGIPGHVHSVWIRRVGVSDLTNADAVRALATGDYVQATYTRVGVGNWLLTQATTGHVGDVLDVDLTAKTYRITNGKQVSAAQWSPDGVHLSYFDALSSHAGTLHIVDVNAGTDTPIGSGIVDNPAPVWSTDGQHILYSTGTHVSMSSVQGVKTGFKLQGSATTFVWSTTSPHEAIVAMRDGQQGIYQVDTQKNVASPLSTEGFSGPIQWSQIP